MSGNYRAIVIGQLYLLLFYGSLTASELKPKIECQFPDSYSGPTIDATNMSNIERIRFEVIVSGLGDKIEQMKIGREKFGQEDNVELYATTCGTDDRVPVKVHSSGGGGKGVPVSARYISIDLEVPLSDREKRALAVEYLDIMKDHSDGQYVEMIDRRELLVQGLVNRMYQNRAGKFDVYATYRYTTTDGVVAVLRSEPLTLEIKDRGSFFDAMIKEAFPDYVRPDPVWTWYAWIGGALSLALLFLLLWWRRRWKLNQSC